jgi:formylglycine-generating enzyme required for sulfatase activity
MTQLTASMEAPGDIGAAPTEAAAEEGIPPTQSETAEAPQAAEEAPAPEVQILTTEWGRRIPGGGAPNKVAVVQGCRIDIGAAAGMDFVLISAGTFEMGSSDGEDQERPQHGVTITKPFYLGKYEVTQAQWAAVMGDNPSFFKGDNMPVDSVSWNDCQEFLKRLNEMAPGHDFRLPTEAEREYACRAGTTTKYWFGGDEVPLEPYAWTDTTSENRPHPVGLLQPNPWGLYDMHGNVWEWCSDWHRGDYYSMSPTEDPRGPSAGEKKVMRGGSWSNPGPYSRSAKRGYYDPTARSNNTGLRVASTAQESAAEAPSVPRPNEALLSKESEIEIGSTARMDFVLIRSGAFEMGSVDGESDEQPVHKVEITVPFYLGKYEVTQAQWVAVMDSNPSVFKGDDLPVDSVTWYDCQEFLKRLNEMAPGHNFRLPTEAEREYACRAGTTMRYSFGDSEDGIERFAWVDTTSGNQPHPVGQLQPNPWGLYDMHGNVWEWCSDWHRGDYYAMSPLEDPQGPDSQDPIVVQGASKKVLRGGSWSNPGPYSRSANRGYYDPNAKHNNYGLRVAWTAE